MKKRKIKLYRVRWWNIAAAILILLGLYALIAPFRHESLKEGFGGNFISEIWGLWVGVIVAWIFFQRFRAERYNNLMRVGFDEPFVDLRKLYSEISQFCLKTPAEARAALTDNLRERLRKCADEIRNRAIFFGRFMELEELYEQKQCADAATALANIDFSISDNHYMTEFVSNIGMIYAKTGYIANLEVDQQTARQYLDIASQWRRKDVNS